MPPTPPHLRLDRITRHSDVLEVACRRCGLDVKLPTSELFAFYGPDQDVWDLVQMELVDCVRWQRDQVEGYLSNTYDLCQGSCPTLARIPSGG